MFNWDTFIFRLEGKESHFHRFLSPCPRELIVAVEKELGKLPNTLSELFKRFNGAELFIAGTPLLSFFRISTIPPLPPLEWAPEWYFEKFTAKWRAGGPNRQSDWAIAMTNYGGLVLLDADETVNEWDTSECKWISKNQSFKKWTENLIVEGEAIMED